MWNANFALQLKFVEFDDLHDILSTSWHLLDMTDINYTA